MNLLACVLPVLPGCPEKNADRMIAFMNAHPAELYLFPAFALTGTTCGALFSQKSFIDRTDRAADRLCEYTETHSVIIVTSLNQMGNVYFRNGSLSQKSRFEWKGKTVAISDTGNDKTDLLLLPTSMTAYPCIEADIAEFCAKASAGCTVAVANPGWGEGVSEGVYRGMCGLFRKGKEIAFRVQTYPEECFVTDTNQSTELFFRKSLGDIRIPYYGKNRPELYLSGLFELQTQALSTRLQASGQEGLCMALPCRPEAILAFLAAEQALILAGKPASVLKVFDTVPETEALARARKASFGREGLRIGWESLTSAALGESPLEESVCHYNICASLPRTLITALLRQRKLTDEGLSALPETLFVDPEGAILTDFILYYAARHRMEPVQIRNYCLATFDEYDEETVDHAISDFFSQFAAAGLRRSLTSEGANITDVTLPYIPLEAACNSTGNLL